jgi:hypothetical protein
LFRRNASSKSTPTSASLPHTMATPPAGRSGAAAVLPELTSCSKLRLGFVISARFLLLDSR